VFKGQGMWKTYPISVIPNKLGITNFDLAFSCLIYPNALELNMGVSSHKLIKLAKATNFG